MAFVSIAVLIRKQFYNLGIVIGRHPMPFIIIPFLLGAVLSAGFFNYTYRGEADSLYNPINSRSYKERQTIERLFKLNKSENFDPSRMTRLGKFGWILVYPKDGKTVLRESIMRQLIVIDNIVNNISIIYKGDTLFYKDICAKNKGSCYKNEILNLRKRIRDIENRRSFVRYPVHIDRESWVVEFYASSIINAKVDDLGYITTAKGVRLLYFLNDYGEEEEGGGKRCYDWETAFLETFQDLNMENVYVHYFVSSSTEREVHRAVLQLIPYYVLLVVVMMMFCIISNLSADWILSKPWLGVTSTVSALLAIVGSTGLVMSCGLPFVDLLMAIPFLLLGIGLDDTFVLLSAWKRTDASKSVEERIGETFSEASVSITITSLTNMISFLFGLTTPFPVVHIFCAYAAVGIAFTYVYQILFFGATLAISGMAEERKLHSVFCIRIKDEWASHGKNIVYRLLCHTSASSNGMKQELLMRFFRNVLGHYLMKNWFRILVLLSYIMYLSAAVWGCFQLIEGTGLEYFVPNDSYAALFFVYFFKDFKQYRDRIQLVIPTPVNYADPVVREEIEQLLHNFEESPLIAKGDMTESWLRYYTKFQSDAIARFYLEKYNLTTKQGYIDALREVFLKYEPAKRFTSDIVFNDNYTEIIASRFFVQTINMGDFNEAKFMLTDLRKIADNSPLQIYMCHFFFGFYDQFLCIGNVAMQTLLICGAVMLILVTLFIPNIRCLIAATLNMISIETGVIGYMAIWGVHVDTISTIILITCVGFSVDYVSHMATSYLGSRKETAAEKMADALYAVGAAIMQGSLSTILGIIVALACNIYIFTCFVKIVILFVIIAFYHSIFLLPMLFLFLDHVFSKYNNSTNQKEDYSAKERTKYILAPQMMTSDLKTWSIQEPAGEKLFEPENC